MPSNPPSTSLTRKTLETFPVTSSLFRPYVIIELALNSEVWTYQSIKVSNFSRKIYKVPSMLFIMNFQSFYWQLRNCKSCTFYLCLNFQFCWKYKISFVSFMWTFKSLLSIGKMQIMQLKIFRFKNNLGKLEFMHKKDKYKNLINQNSTKHNRQG